MGLLFVAIASITVLAASGRKPSPQTGKPRRKRKPHGWAGPTWTDK